MKLSLGRWLPWVVAGLLALAVLVVPRGVEGLAAHDKAVKCVEDGNVWLNGKCCLSYDGETQKCTKGASASSKKPKGSGKGKKSSKGKKSGKGDTGDTGDTGDEPKPKKKGGGGGGGKTVEARYHTYKTRGEDGDDIGQTYCADKLGGKGGLSGKPWMALDGITLAQCGKRFRVTNTATGKSETVYAVDSQGAGGIDLDAATFRALDGEGTNGGSGQGVQNGHMDVTYEQLD